MLFRSAPNATQIPDRPDWAPLLIIWKRNIVTTKSLIKFPLKLGCAICASILGTCICKVLRVVEGWILVSVLNRFLVHVLVSRLQLTLGHDGVDGDELEATRGSSELGGAAVREAGEEEDDGEVAGLDDPRRGRGRRGRSRRRGGRRTTLARRRWPECTPATAIPSSS